MEVHRTDEMFDPIVMSGTDEERRIFEGERSQIRRSGRDLASFLITAIEPIKQASFPDGVLRPDAGQTVRDYHELWSLAQGTLKAFDRGDVDAATIHCFDLGMTLPRAKTRRFEPMVKSKQRSDRRRDEGKKRKTASSAKAIRDKAIQLHEEFPERKITWVRNKLVELNYGSLSTIRRHTKDLF